MEAQTAITPASITLADGKKRTLIFPNAVMKQIAEEYGVSVMKEGTWKLFQMIDEKTLPALLVLGLNHNFPGGWPGVTAADLDQVLTAQNTIDVLHALDAAFGRSLIKNALEALALLARPEMQAVLAVIRTEAEKVKAQVASQPNPETVM